MSRHYRVYSPTKEDRISTPTLKGLLSWELDPSSSLHTVRLFYPFRFPYLSRFDLTSGPRWPRDDHLRVITVSSTLFPLPPSVPNTHLSSLPHKVGFFVVSEIVHPTLSELATMSGNSSVVSSSFTVRHSLFSLFGPFTPLHRWITGTDRSDVTGRWTIHPRKRWDLVGRRWDRQVTAMEGL